MVNIQSDTELMVDFMLSEFYRNWKKKKKLGQIPVCAEKWADALRNQSLK